MKLHSLSYAVLLLCLLTSVTVAAPDLQTSSASQRLIEVSGTVFDPNKAVVLGTVIVFESKVVRREVTVDENGEYKVMLPAGKYKVSAQAIGFFAYKKQLRVKGEQSVRFDIYPKPGPPSH